MKMIFVQNAYNSIKALGFDDIIGSFIDFS